MKYFQKIHFLQELFLNVLFVSCLAILRIRLHLRKIKCIYVLIILNFNMFLSNILAFEFQDWIRNLPISHSSAGLVIVNWRYSLK